MDQKECPEASSLTTHSIMTKLDLAQWQDGIATLIAASLDEFRPGVNDALAVFAVDLHPWNGGLWLAILTEAERIAEPAVAKASEMAAWKHYDFASTLSCSESMRAAAFKMRAEYELAGEQRRQ